MNQVNRLRKQLYISIGLSDKEGVVYDVLLQKGELAASSIEKETGLKKNTYTLLKSLVRKKLVVPFLRDSIQWYQAASPDHLEDLLNEQYQSINQTKQLLGQLMPVLKTSYTMAVNKPTIRYYEGEEGIKNVFSDIYSAKDEPVYGCVDLEKADSVFPKHILQDLIPLRVKHNLFAYSLVSDSKQAREIKLHDEQQLRQTVLVNKEKYPLPAEIDVYENKIAMLSFERNEFVGLIIENQPFAQTIKSILKLALLHSDTTPVTDA